MEVPTVLAYNKTPAENRSPCLLDALALTALRAANSKLHKKAAIALTKWAVWAPDKPGWLTKAVVQFQMFQADVMAEFRDLRIRDEGRLVSWKTHTQRAQRGK